MDDNLQQSSGSSDIEVNTPGSYYEGTPEADSERSMKLNSAANSHDEEQHSPEPQERSNWKVLAQNGEGYFETKAIDTSVTCVFVVLLHLLLHHA